MKSLLSEWDGKFIVDGKVSENLDEFNPEDGEEFEIELIPENEK